MATGWTLKGVDLRRVGYNIRTTGGWDSFPASRFASRDYPFRHGEIIEARTFYLPKDISLVMEVLPTNPDGTQTLTPAEHVQANLDELLGLCYSVDGSTIPLVKTIGSSQRQADVRVLDAFDVQSGFGPHGRAFVMRLRMPYPFWHHLPQVTGQSGTPLVNDGNAPIQDAVITFSTAGRLTHTASGAFVESSAGGVVVNLAQWTITQGGSPADNLVSYNKPWLMEFRPGSNALSRTGTILIDYYHSSF